MKYSVEIPNGWKMNLAMIKDPVEACEAMTNVAKAADDYGYESIWMVDHFHTVPTPSQEVTFETWMSLAALARDTRRVRIGQIVTCNGYRNHALLAKMASTLDVLSHGRLNFGIGAGWYEHEYRAYGYPYPDAPQRLPMLREALQVILAMWTQEEPAFKGAYYQVRGAINQPRDTSLVGSPQTIRRRIAALENVGIHELILDFPTSATDLMPIHRFAREFLTQ